MNMSDLADCESRIVSKLKRQFLFHQESRTYKTQSDRVSSRLRQVRQGKTSTADAKDDVDEHQFSDVDVELPAVVEKTRHFVSLLCGLLTPFPFSVSVGGCRSYSGPQGCRLVSLDYDGAAVGDGRLV